MTEPPLPEESIFAQALEITSAADRAAFLERACGHDQALRAEVEALLRAHDQSGVTRRHSGFSYGSTGRPAIKHPANGTEPRDQ